MLVGTKQGGTSTFPSLLGSGRIPSYRLEVVYGIRRHLVLTFISSRRESWVFCLSFKPGLQCLNISPLPLEPSQFSFIQPFLVLFSQSKYPPEMRLSAMSFLKHRDVMEQKTKNLSVDIYTSCHCKKNLWVSKIFPN